VPASVVPPDEEPEVEEPEDEPEDEEPPSPPSTPSSVVCWELDEQAWTIHTAHAARLVRDRTMGVHPAHITDAPGSTTRALVAILAFARQTLAGDTRESAGTGPSAS
jgi:hypothetical protein